MSFSTSASAQSDMPQFSDPYGGANAYVHSGETPASPKLKKVAPRKLAKTTNKTSKKQDAAHASAAASQDASAPPVASAKTASPAVSDNPVSFGMRWNGANNPTFSTGTSTIPAVNEIKRNANEEPVETGNGIQAGVNMKF